MEKTLTHCQLNSGEDNSNNQFRNYGFGSEVTLTLDSWGLSLLARDFVMAAVKKYTLLLQVKCPFAHTPPCQQNLLAINVKSLPCFPGFLIQLTSLQMASLALRTLRFAARNQQPLFYIAQVLKEWYQGGDNKLVTIF